MAAIRRILVPTDFSDASAHALRYACGLADGWNASLDIIHVTENPFLAAGYMELYVPAPQYFEDLDREVIARLSGLLTSEETDRYRVTIVRRTGSAAQEILDYIREQPTIDLVVMATHGRGGVARLMMGSVADKVVRAAPCPVLTMRTAEAQAERSNRAA